MSRTDRRTYRVVQWTTGNVGERTARAVLDNPAYELVGCYAWSPDKAGRDVGDLIGIEPTGVLATNDVDALLALKPDCVVYTPKWIDVDELVRILEAGVNVVATAGFITGHALGEGRQRLLDACERGGSSMFGSGINPGMANLFAIVSAGICDRVDSVRVLESVDSTGYDSPETELPAGFGRPLGDPELPAMVAHATAVFGDAVHLMADALGVELTDVRCVPAFAQTTELLVMDSWSIEAGCVAGIEASWEGWVGDRKVISLDFRWRKGQTLEPDWQIEHGYLIEVEGLPCVRTKVEMLPPADFQGTSFKDFMAIGMIATGLPAVNAIPSVCAGAPGIVTYLDIPVPAPAGWSVG